MGHVIQFPSELNKYVNFKTDDKEIDRFNAMLEKVIEIIEESYPEIEEMCPEDYILISESITSCIMRNKDIEHPLQEFADTTMPEYFEEYGL